MYAMDSITVRIGGAERTVSVKRLIEMSEVFRDIFKNEQPLEDTIELESGEGIGDAIYNNFLEYLDTGTTKLKGENAFFLLLLSQGYVVPLLTKCCVEFIGDNIEMGNLIEILNSAIEWDLNELKWECSAFAFENSLDENFLSLLDNELISEEARSVLEYGIKCHLIKFPQKKDQEEE